MTQMSAHERFEDAALVEAWLKEPTFLEPVDEGRVAAIVHQTPQARRWPPQLDLGRFTPMLNATKFVAASVILALTGGLLFAVLPTEPTTELMPAAATATGQATASPTATAEATTEVATEPPLVIDPDTPVITLPDQLPEDLEGGTIDTPAGPARWVHLTGTDGSLPFPFMVVLPWGDGIASWDGYHGELHTSPDGIAWTRVEKDWPMRGTMTIAGDTYVLVDAARGRVMTATDPEGEWQELDASALEAARLTGWETDEQWLAQAPLLVDDRIVFAVRYGYRLPKRELGISSDGTKNFRALPDGRYVLCSAGPRSSCGADGKWVLRLKETDQGLVVRHDRTGKRLGLVEGASADQIYTGERGVYRRMFAIEDDRVVEIDSPWPSLTSWQAANRTVAPGGTDPVVTQWRSDGRASDSTPGLPDIVAELPRGGWLRVEGFPDRLVAYAGGGVSRELDTWTSIDGIEWTPAPSGAPDGTEVRWTGSGWLASGGDYPRIEYWMHIGGEWVSLDEMGLGAVAEPRGVGNVTLVAGGRSAEDQELWVLTHPVETE